MTNMVTMIQPAGFSCGVVASSVVLATLQSRRAFGGFGKTPFGLVPAPVREQRIMSVRR